MVWPHLRRKMKIQNIILSEPTALACKMALQNPCRALVIILATVKYTVFNTVCNTRNYTVSVCSYMARDGLFPLQPSRII